MITDAIPAPKKRIHERRLTPELRAVKPGQSAILDVAAARSFVQFLKYTGKDAVRRTIGADKVQVWCIEKGA